MADKTTPGGVLYDPVNGKRLDEPSSANLDARLREVSVTAAVEADRAEAAAKDAGASAARAESIVADIDDEVRAVVLASPELKGEPGAPGAPGPAPSIKIGTVTSGTTPSAAIKGTSPDLTLDLVLPQPDPGAVVDPYSIRGPGRPDTPSTTGGVITGSEPVGAEFRSQDGAQVGAYVWMKRPGGEWEVTDGDTGWRVFTLAPAPWNGTVSVRVRRIGRTVYMEPHAPSTFGVWRLGTLDASGVGGTVAFTLGDAFRPANRVAAQIVNGGDGGDGERLGRVLVDGTNGAVRVKHPANNALAMTAAWPTVQPWPSTLPGTPA